MKNNNNNQDNDDFDPEDVLYSIHFTEDGFIIEGQEDFPPCHKCLSKTLLAVVMQLLDSHDEEDADEENYDEAEGDSDDDETETGDSNEINLK